MSAGCSGCDRRWTSTAQAHCQTCHRQFGTHGVADRHTVQPTGDRRDGYCGDPATMTDKHGWPMFVVVDETAGPVWRTAPSSTITGGLLPPPPSPRVPPPRYGPQNAAQR